MDTKKLRQKILDLAMHGKLVPQDPNDEPTSVLLERIRAEKERLIKEGKIKRSKKLSTDDKIEAPFEIPESWEWVRLKTITSKIVDGDHNPPSGQSNDTGFYMLSSKNIIHDSVEELDDVRFLSYNDWKKCNERTNLMKGDVLWTTVATLGRSCVYEKDVPYCFQRSVSIISTYINNYFLKYCFDSPYYQSLIDDKATGTAQRGFYINQLEESDIPVPPFSEQQRISSEIERWLAVIDELESNEDDLLKAIEQAKSKILELAIHGKLVSQDPNDEPAIELLKRINPKFEACDNVLDTTQLPDSWCWAKLESISTDSADGPFGSNLKKEHYTTNKEVRIIQLSNIGDEGWREENTKYTTFEHLKDISRSEVLPNDIVIAKMMPAGRAILCPNNEHKYVLSSDAVKFHIVDNIDCRYILYAINSDMFRKQVYENVQGVTRVRTSLQKLRKYCLPLPPYQEQLRIVAKIEELFSVLDSIKESLA